MMLITYPQLLFIVIHKLKPSMEYLNKLMLISYKSLIISIY